MNDTMSNPLEISHKREGMDIKPKYFYFGWRLWRLREKRKMSSQTVATYLNISGPEYRRFESGEALPDKNVMSELAKIMEVEFSRLIKWKTEAMHSLSDAVVHSGALKYSSHWKTSLEKFRLAYLEQFQLESDVGREVMKVLVNLEKDVSRIVSLPVLPMNLFLILDAIMDEDNRKVKFLHEISNFVIEGESLAGYVSRDSYFGPYVNQAAHKLFFHNGPSLGIEDCFNRLTMDQFTDIFFAAIANGIYSNYQELPALQQYHEFASLGALMVREIKPYLPKSVNFEHLYMAMLLQGIGTYSFYTLLVPSDRIQKEVSSTKHEFLESLNVSIMGLINYEFHACVAGFIAANWDYPEEVVNALIDHHKTPVESVTPLCAAVKFINYFVDCDFPDASKEDLTALLLKYPQINIPVESLLKVTNKMHQMSKNLIEMSSVLIESKVKDAADFTSKRIKGFKDNNEPVKSMGTLITHKLPSRSESRFLPEYGKILSIECQALFNKFMQKKLFFQKGDTLQGYQNRMAVLQARRKYLDLGDLSNVAEEFSVSPNEMKELLKL